MIKSLKMSYKNTNIYFYCRGRTPDRSTQNDVYYKKIDRLYSERNKALDSEWVQTKKQITFLLLPFIKELKPRIK